MTVGILDQIGALITSIGLDPALTMIGLSFIIAILPGLRRGYLDNRLDSFVENLDYGLVSLSIGFLLAFYYQYGLTGVQGEIIGITGGFVLGTTTVTFIQKLTGIKG
jgi:hypothetical protein